MGNSRSMASKVRLMVELVDALEIAQDPAGRNDYAADAALADEQVAADAVPEHRRACLEVREEAFEILDIGRLEKPFGRPAGAPGRMPVHRLVLPEFAANAHVVDRRHHVCTLNLGLWASRSGRLCA